MPLVVRSFRRSDRDQLTDLVNRHVQCITPGVRLSVNAVLSQLEGEPLERQTEAQVRSRFALVAETDLGVVAAVLVHEVAVGDSDPGGSVASAPDGLLRWFVCEPNEPIAGRKLLSHLDHHLEAKGIARLFTDTSLSSLGCRGISDSWPHLHTLLVEAGFEGPDRYEEVLALPCDQIDDPDGSSVSVRRSMGSLGTVLDVADAGGAVGWIEVCDAEIPRHADSSANWADIGNVVLAKGRALEDLSLLYRSACSWLRLACVDYLVDYYAADVRTIEERAAMMRTGFVLLSTNGRGWQRHR